MSAISLWILLSLAALVWVVVLLRQDRFSLGLPIAYLANLLLIHVPGAAVRLVTNAFDYDAEIIEVGMRFAAIGALCFAAGVQIARFLNRRRPAYYYVERKEFWYFCLIGGLLLAFGVRLLAEMPGIMAAVNRGGLIWLLGVLLALRFALASGDQTKVVTWTVGALVYPCLMLLFGGFLSYGVAALLVVASGLAVSARSRARLIVSAVLCTFVGLTIFVNYFAHRTEFRETAWSGASLGARISAAAALFSDFKWFDTSDLNQLNALNQRLNQNYFVGLAAARLEQEQVAYLYGKSVSDGFLALVPRALWPDKPVTGGSGTIVAEMTGLHLSEETSWGVGNVMEFEINFGTTGVVIGFLLLGFIIGWLDYKAALADARGDIPKLILFFLVGLAFIQPNGAITEITGGAAAAVVASFVWTFLWRLWLSQSRRHAAGRELTSYR